MNEPTGGRFWSPMVRGRSDNASATHLTSSGRKNGVPSSGAISYFEKYSTTI